MEKACFGVDQICIVKEGDLPPFIPHLLQKYKGPKACGEKFMEMDNDLVRVTAQTLNKALYFSALAPS